MLKKLSASEAASEAESEAASEAASEAESEAASEVAVNTKADSQKKAPGRGRLPKNGKYIPELDEIRHIHDNTLWNKTLKKFE